MAGNAGVWLDHRKALVVALTTEGERTTLINSQTERLLERSGDSPLNGRFESMQVPADDSRQRALTGHLNVYYDQVMTVLKHFDHVILFGPGEAKGELHKRMQKARLDARIASIETEDKMTDPQIIDKVRRYFANAAHQIPQPT
jgi:hypothetical protein